MIPAIDTFTEYPIVEGAERTYGSVLRETREVLHDLASKMTKDRSYDHAKEAIAAAELLGSIVDEEWIDSMPLDWEPE